MTPEARRAQIIAAAREVFLRHGFAGTRVRDIAEQAGITENLVYIRFATKAEIYEAAVTDPLDALVESLVAAAGRLGTTDRADRADRQRVFEEFHRVLLTNMLDTAPLLAVALFSDPAAGRKYYREVMLPRFTEAVGTVISDVTGWPLDSLRLDVLVEGVLGLHFGLALDSIFDERALDAADVARQLAIMFGYGILDKASRPRASRPAPEPAPVTAHPVTAHPVTAHPVTAAPVEASPDIVAPAEASPGAPVESDTETRVRMPAAERRADIARAAREVFVERGPAGARTKEIAERAGITEAFMFRVFNGKEELYQEAIEAPARALMSRMERELHEVIVSGDGGIETMRALVETGLTVLSELAPILVVALFSEMDRGRSFYRGSVIPALRQTEEYLTHVPGWDTGAVDPEILWRAIFGVQFGTVVHHQLTEEPIDAPTIAQRLTRLIATGIR
jgi:AcrR family transcriptional regulator